VLLAIASAAIGAFAGVKWALAFALLVLVVQSLFGTYHTERLWRLLDAPVYGQVPSAPGVWGEIYYRLHKLAKRWHAQVRQVEQQHSRFIQAIQASPNGVAMLDDHDQIEWCNAIAEEHFGLDARRDLRQHITHLVRHPEFVRYLNSHRYEQMLIMRGMGDKRQNVLSVQVFPYGENRKLVLSADITELERTDSMRRDFVANVSHELKTPLTVLSGFLETMRELPLDEADRARYLELMEQQASRMRHIVDDLLVLAKLEGDAKPPSDHAIDMVAVLRHLREDAATLSRPLLADPDARIRVTAAVALAGSRLPEDVDAAEAALIDLAADARGSSRTVRKDVAAAISLEVRALVDQERGVATVIQEQGRTAAVGPHQRLLGAPPVFRKRLAFPGEHRNALGIGHGALAAHRHGGRGMILG